jgi:hypothetical protein
VVVLVAATLVGCGLVGGKDAPPETAQRVRLGDLPTAKEVATIYPGIEYREDYSHERDPFARKHPRCVDDWRSSTPFTAGRWSNYQGKGHEDPFFTGGEGVGVDVFSFASAKAAKEAAASFTKYVDACRGHHSSGDGYDFTRRKLDLPDGYVGYHEKFVVDMDTAEPTFDESLYLLTSRDEFLVGVRIQTDTIEPNETRALELARLARRVVGRAPEGAEPVPDGAVLQDDRKKPVFVPMSGKASISWVDFPPRFREFLRDEAAKVKPVKGGGEYVIEDCTTGMNVQMYRTDGFALLDEVNCVGDGASRQYFVAAVDGAWKVIREDCAHLTKVHFPSSIVGAWCRDGSGKPHEYPLG